MAIFPILRPSQHSECILCTDNRGGLGVRDRKRLVVSTWTALSPSFTEVNLRIRVRVRHSYSFTEVRVRIRVGVIVYG